MGDIVEAQQRHQSAVLEKGVARKDDFIKGMLPLRPGFEEQVAMSFLFYLWGPGPLQ